MNNGAVHNSRLLTLPRPAHTTNNFAPNEFREVVNLSGLVVYKGSNARGKLVTVIAAERKQTQ